MDAQIGAMELQWKPITKSRKKYTREFKLEAVRSMIEQNRTARDVEESLGIGWGLLCGWKSKLAAEGALAFTGNGNVNPHEAEMRELLRDLNRVRQERDILKRQRPTSRKSRTEVRWKQQPRTDPLARRDLTQLERVDSSGRGGAVLGCCFQLVGETLAAYASLHGRASRAERVPRPRPGNSEPSGMAALLSDAALGDRVANPACARSW